MNELANQIALVTGAGRGIGQAIALKLAASGADIVAVDLKPEFLEETVAEVRKLGRQAWAVAANVAEASSVDVAVEQILKDAGRLDILVNNAGITRDGLLAHDEADWDAVWILFLKGTFPFPKALTRAFLKQRSDASLTTFGNRLIGTRPAIYAAANLRYRSNQGLCQRICQPRNHR